MAIIGYPRALAVACFIDHRTPFRDEFRERLDFHVDAGAIRRREIGVTTLNPDDRPRITVRGNHHVHHKPRHPPVAVRIGRIMGSMSSPVTKPPEKGGFVTKYCEAPHLPAVIRRHNLRILCGEYL